MFKMFELKTLLLILETDCFGLIAYPERIAQLARENNASFKLANGRIAAIGLGMSLGPMKCCCRRTSRCTRSMVKNLGWSRPLNPKDLMPMIKTKEVISWDRKGV